MNYLITESKLKNVIYNFLNNYNDFKDLKEFDGDFMDWENGKWVEATEFGHFDWDPIITYYKYPSETEKYDDIDLEILPLVHVNDGNFRTMMGSLFGDMDKYEDIFLDWFEDTYGYRANNLT